MKFRDRRRRRKEGCVHVAHALWGDRQERISRLVRALLIPLGVLTAFVYGWPAFAAGLRGELLWAAVMPGVQWLLWWLVLVGAGALLLRWVLQFPYSVV